MRKSVKRIPIPAEKKHNAMEKHLVRLVNQVKVKQNELGVKGDTQLDGLKRLLTEIDEDMKKPKYNKRNKAADLQIKKEIQELIQILQPA